MELQLIVVGGKASKQEVTLKLPAVIGRGREADLTVAYPTISRRHCRVFETDGLAMVRDLDSLNGTLVNGQRISEAALPPDGEFTIGPLSFRVKYEYDGDLSDIPAPKLSDKKKSRRPAAEEEEEEAADLVGSNSRTEALPAGSQGGRTAAAATGDEDDMMIDFEEIPQDGQSEEAPADVPQPQAAGSQGKPPAPSSPKKDADSLDDDIFKDFMEGSQ